ncbi:MAG: N-acetylmuramoyl-L-alanine amidase [Prevotella sp.]|nr:N-acetylmuramoyl-L-alanine amidase [Prevotella sp.]MBR3858527.1 N-acetylmuramoyl-L-alanine amidase [Bacteroidaceae bacterium]
MKKLCVILDNGHGKDTPGKCSPDRSLYEWQWTRDIACGLYQRLLEEGIEAQLLVPEQTDIPLSARVARENQTTTEAKRAGKETCLISVHINAAGGDGKWKSARGFSCWIAQSASPKSKQLAQLLYAEAEARELQGNRSVPAEKYWVAPFYITTHSSCPAVLTENLFQDNKEDVAFLLSDAGKQTIIDLHVQAIKKYIAI